MEPSTDLGFFKKNLGFAPINSGNQSIGSRELVNLSQPMINKENFVENTSQKQQLAYDYPILDTLSTCTYTPQGSLICSPNVKINDIPKGYSPHKIL